VTIIVKAEGPRRYILTTQNTHWFWPNTCELLVTKPWIEDTNGDVIDEKALKMAIRSGHEDASSS